MNEWRSVVEYEGIYEISNSGEIRRVLAGQGARCGIIKSFPGEGGYRRTRLCANGKAKTVLVHRLVATAFIGPVPRYSCVNHLDGNPLNNCVENLEITSYSGNIRHAMRYLGHWPKGQPGMKNVKAKLTNDNVQEMRSGENYRGKATFYAKKFGVSATLASNIINGKVWRHLI